jgi:hypothetical protein
MLRLDAVTLSGVPMLRGLVLVITGALSLGSVGSALGADVPEANTPFGATDAWQTYRSERGGFSVDVPATWIVAERMETQGVLITTLTPSNGAAIAVISQPGASVNQGDADLMNVRCTAVMVAERPARSCLDTISFSVSTTVVGSGKTYIITSNRKRGDQRVYNRVLASFRIL